MFGPVKNGVIIKRYIDTAWGEQAAEIAVASESIRMGHDGMYKLDWDEDEFEDEES